MKNKVNILGTEYKLFLNVKTEKEPRLEKAYGFTDFCVKEIVISEDTEKQEEQSMKNLIEFRNKVIRHEIVHAYLYESGLRENSEKQYAWADNEEMVDWFAIQGPKIFKTYKELGVL